MLKVNLSLDKACDVLFWCAILENYLLCIKTKIRKHTKFIIGDLMINKKFSVNVCTHPPHNLAAARFVFKYHIAEVNGEEDGFKDGNKWSFDHASLEQSMQMHYKMVC